MDKTLSPVEELLNYALGFNPRTPERYDIEYLTLLERDMESTVKGEFWNHLMRKLQMKERELCVTWNEGNQQALLIIQVLKQMPEFTRKRLQDARAADKARSKLGRQLRKSTGSLQ